MKKRDVLAAMSGGVVVQIVKTDGVIEPIGRGRLKALNFTRYTAERLGPRITLLPRETAQHHARV